jgi:asparagine synthase (glutamine-hydrolysing)
MKEFHKGELHTFSVGFNQKSYNELDDADKVAEWINTKHHGIIIGNENNNVLLEDSLDVFDELLSDNSLIPMVEVSKLASNYVKVVLSGDGGDELFGGYITYKADQLLPWVKKIVPRFLRNELAKNRKVVSSKKLDYQFKMQQFFYGSKYDYRKAHYLWRLIFRPEERIKILGEDNRELVYDTDPVRKFMDYYRQVEHLDILDQHLYVDAMTWLTDDILVKVDRSSMASSIEARAPFLDIDLVNYASSIPSNLKLKNLSSKYILKKAVTNQIPDFSIYKKKSGFNSPVNIWIDREEGNEFQDFNKYVFNRKSKK